MELIVKSSRASPSQYVAFRAGTGDWTPAPSSISILGPTSFSNIWLIGLISIPIVAQFTKEIISNEMKKNTIIPVLYSARNHSNSFRNVIRNSIFPITGVLCFNVGISILLFEGVNSIFSYISFGSISFIKLGMDIRKNSYPSPLFDHLIPSILLFLSVSGFILLGLGLYDYKLKKTAISKKK